MPTVTKRFMDRGYLVELTYPTEGRLFHLKEHCIDDDHRKRSFVFEPVNDNTKKQLKQIYDNGKSPNDTPVVYVIAKQLSKPYFIDFMLLLKQSKVKLLETYWAKEFFFAVSDILKTA